jgi:hypothetical protein
VIGRVLLLFLLLAAPLAAQEYRVPPQAVTVRFEDVPGVVRLDVPGRPRVAGILPEEMVAVAPRAGRVFIVHGGGGRLYRPLGRPRPLIWSGRVAGAWALSSDGNRLALEGDGGVVDVYKLVGHDRTRLLRRIHPPGPVRLLFSRDSRRLMLIDGQLMLESHDLEKRAAPRRLRLVPKGEEGMLESIEMLPDNHTLVYNVQRENGEGGLYCCDVQSDRIALAAAYHGEDWTSSYRFSWDGRFVWTGTRMSGGGSEVVSDVDHVGLRGADEAPLVMRALMTWPGPPGRPGIATVGSAVAYSIGDRVEVYDPSARRLIRIVGWPTRQYEADPAVVGFLEPQRMLAVQMGASVFLLPVAYRGAVNRGNVQGRPQAGRTVASCPHMFVRKRP